MSYVTRWKFELVTFVLIKGPYSIERTLQKSIAEIDVTRNLKVRYY